MTFGEGELPFPPVEEATWRALVEKALKGGSVDALASETDDGLRFPALGPPVSGVAPVTVRAGAWTVVQRIDSREPAAANTEALAGLAGGADGLALVFAGAPTAYGCGVALATRDDLAAVLAGIDLRAIALRLEAGRHWREAAALLAAHCEAERIDPSSADVTFGADPFAAAAVDGRLGDPGTGGSELAETASALSRRGFAGPFALADGRPWHAAGATDVQELAVVLATAAEELRALAATGHGLDAALAAIGAAVAVDQQQFAAIAKLRALRLCWQTVAGECGVPETPLRLHAETAWRMMTRRDAQTNIVRTTIAAFAAGVGGADSVAVLPYSIAAGVPDGFARRIARNTQTILIKEAHVGRAADPGAGAGAIEARTDALAGAAWELFRDIERRGGLGKALEAGFVQGLLADAAARRRGVIDGGERTIVGVTRYANATDEPVRTAADHRSTEPPTGPAQALDGASDQTFDSLVSGCRDGAFAPSPPQRAPGAIARLVPERLSARAEEAAG